MRIAFLGTPDFAVPSLEMLIKQQHDIAGVFCQPDRKSGRGHKVSFSPVKETALTQGLPVFQFDKIKSPEGVAALKSLDADLMITAAFGQILSQEILDIPRLGCINVHASLLPKYRGAAPVQWAIMNGETETGITTMMTNAGLDTGDILLKKKTKIGETETGGGLYQRLAVLGAQTLKETLEQLEAGKLKPEKQDEAQASYYPMLTKDMAKLDFSQSANDLINQVRALDPVMKCFVNYNGESVKLLKLSRTAVSPSGKPGEIIVSDPKSGLIVMTGDMPVMVDEIQMPGGKRMNAKDFLRGRSIPAGEFFE